jgi:ABC-type antimicrobial peptide transport system permease subunit
MIKNYFRVAVRNLFKNKSYVIINTFGLGISLACCVTAYLLLAFNIEFDNFHATEKVENIFKVHTISHEQDGRLARDVQAPIVMAPIAKEEIAGIESYARFLYGGGSLLYGEKAFNEGIGYTDSTFFDLFDYPLVAGSHKSFKEKNSVFLSEEYAKKYFGEEDPIGKLMVLNPETDKEVELLVGGVVKVIPENNTFTFNILMRIENFMEEAGIAVDDWKDWRNPATFFKLSTPENAEQVSKAFSKYIPNRNLQRTDMKVEAYELVPFKSKYSQDDIRYNWVTHRINAFPLIVFTSMAGLILLIACFNLTNTSIAITASRLKEVGVRKAVGAARKQIITQFLFETLIIIALSLVVGLLLAQIIVPAFTNMWEIRYSLKDLNGLNFFIAMIGLVFMASLLAGIYPALFSSKLKPTLLLKGAIKIKGTNVLTRSLVSLQFALSVIVLVAGITFIRNTKFQESLKFGYDKDMIITVRLQGEKDYEVMRNAVSSNSKILSVGVSDGNLGSSTYQTPIRIDTAQYNVQTAGVGINYFETMGIELIDGRLFNLDNASDQGEAVLVNKTFLEKTGMQDPLDKVIVLHDTRRRIVGVLEDHIDNLGRSKELEPFVFYPAGKDQYINLVVKTEKADVPEIQKYLEKTWKEVFPTRPFEARTQDDLLLSNSREVNGNLQKIFLFITILGGLLSASGIFALASLNIARRTKEIGIRKALGATVSSIVGLLNKEFVIILIIAGIIGSVGGYFLTGALLDNIYAYHIAVGILPVILCALVIFIVGIFTTSSTILKAAHSNPVDTLRSE